LLLHIKSTAVLSLSAKSVVYVAAWQQNFKMYRRLCWCSGSGTI